MFMLQCYNVTIHDNVTIQWQWQYNDNVTIYEIVYILGFIFIITTKFTCYLLKIRNSDKFLSKNYTNFLFPFF